MEIFWNRNLILLSIVLSVLTFWVVNSQSSITTINGDWIEYNEEIFSYYDVKTININPSKINIPQDYFNIGDKVQLKQDDNAFKYFYITDVKQESIIIYAGTDFVLMDEPIDEISFSKLSTPTNFPHEFVDTSIIPIPGTNMAIDYESINKYYVSLKGSVVTVRLEYLANIVTSGTTTPLLFPYPIQRSNPDHILPIGTFVNLGFLDNGSIPPIGNIALTLQDNINNRFQVGKSNGVTGLPFQTHATTRINTSIQYTLVNSN